MADKTTLEYTMFNPNDSTPGYTDLQEHLVARDEWECGDFYVAFDSDCSLKIRDGGHARVKESIHRVDGIDTFLNRRFSLDTDRFHDQLRLMGWEDAFESGTGLMLWKKRTSYGVPGFLVDVHEARFSLGSTRHHCLTLVARDANRDALRSVLDVYGFDPENNISYAQFLSEHRVQY